MWHWHGMGSWWWLVMIGIWALVVLSVFWAVRSAAGRSQPEQNTALRILDERLARGEIDRDDYEDRRRILESDR